MNDAFSSLAFDEQRSIDALCDRFEAESRAGRPPRIGDLVAQLPLRLRQAALKELLDLEAALSRSPAPPREKDAERSPWLDEATYPPDPATLPSVQEVIDSVRQSDAFHPPSPIRSSRRGCYVRCTGACRFESR